MTNLTKCPVASLPHPGTRAGEPRRVGIEVECSGLTEAQVARFITEEFGGTATRESSYDWQVSDTAIGDVKVLLDTSLRDKAETGLAKLGLDLSRAVVPVEFVTDPILPEQIAEVDRLCGRLREEGASGSRDGLLLGFGVHFNVATTGPEARDLVPVLRAYALLEDWLRLADPIDPARRLLPFVDAYSHAFVDLLATEAAADWSVDDLFDAYLEHADSRNHGLDMLPLLRDLDDARIAEALDGGVGKQVSARPAWHYRLPDSRIDEPQWSIAGEWDRWCLVETVADSPDLLSTLAEAYRDHRRHMTATRRGWCRKVQHILEEADLAEAAA